MARSPDVDGVLKKVGRRVAAARLHMEFTQEAAASKAGIDVKRWQRIEAGEVNATIRTLVRVATALGMTVWELLGPKPSTPRSRRKTNAKRA